MDEYVNEKVNGPGLALMITGILMVVGQLIGLIFQAITAIPSAISLVNAGAGADAWISFVTSQGIGVISSLVGFFVGFIVAFGGSRLRALRSPGMVYAGAALAIIPCCSGYCCCIGLPVGIWAIMTMQDEKVKAAFTD